MCNKDCLNCVYDDCIIPDGGSSWAKRNPEKHNEAVRRYYQSHKEQVKAYQKKYYEKIKNTPEYKEMRREYVKAYREKKKLEAMTMEVNHGE